MQGITRYRRRALIAGLRFFLSICSSWIQSAPAAATVPHPLVAIARATEWPVQFAFAAVAVDEKK
jgi:hypothetical protein